MQKAKRFFFNTGKYALKYAVRAGVIVAGSAIGAHLDLPDFDFDIDVPDIDNDFDLDIDIGQDIQNDITSDDGLITNCEINSSDQYNVSFGAQTASLDRSGGGFGSLNVTITKQPGSSNLFSITDSHTTIPDVKGGTKTIWIDGIKYKLPTLKG